MKKSAIPKDILMKIGDLMEKELTDSGVDFKRNGLKWKIHPAYVHLYRNAQINANEKLIKDGVITMDMIVKDYLIYESHDD